MIVITNTIVFFFGIFFFFFLSLQCPFHGKIIPRDPVGQPYNPEDKLQEEEEKEKKQQG